MSTVRRVAATSWARNTRAPAAAASAVAARVPSSRSVTSVTPSVSPMKSLFDNAISTGQPVATSSSQRRSRASPWKVFLPKSWVGSMTMPSRGTPSATQALGLAGHLGDHVGHHVDVAHAVRAPARHRATGVRADDADAGLRGHLAERRVGARPRCR